MELLFEFSAMGSSNEIRLAGHDEPMMQAAAQAAIKEIHRIEFKYSRYRAQSLLSNLNALAGTGIPLELDSETIELLNFADAMYHASGGLFDVSSGVLQRAWNFSESKLPTPKQVEALLPLVRWPLVERNGSLVYLSQLGMQLDFGGFGKEYAVDRATQVLLSSGQKHGYVNMGGDIGVIGPKQDGGAWQFGIQHPRLQGEVVAVVGLSSGALATSGDYERFVEVSGVRYSHLLSPKTGWPVQYWQSISAAAPTCAAAGALCTIAILKGEQGIEFLLAQSVDYLALATMGNWHSPSNGTSFRVV
jgi:thiamine biosynthesis lipoprotein